MIPLLLAIEPTRWSIHATMWLGALLGLRCMKKHAPDFSWKKLWHGEGWNAQDRRNAMIRFFILAPIITIFAYYFVPDRFFAFPMERPVFWLIVMILYPILSVVPQEFLFRSFFFYRYAGLLTNKNAFLLINGFLFGWCHIVFHNIISPLFCLVGGVMFAANYYKHRSLKYVTLAHAAYGCLIFTVGLGKYFLVNAGPRV